MEREIGELLELEAASDEAAPRDAATEAAP